MKKLKFVPFRELSTEGFSTRILYILIGLTAVVFAAFFLIGYDMPYEEDPSFNAPLLTDLLPYFMMLLVLLAIITAVYSVVKSIRQRDKGDNVSNGIPATKIAYSSLGFLVGCLILTFLFGSSEPLKVNGTMFKDTFWLKATDMLVNTSLIMLLATIGCVIYGFSRYHRKMQEKEDDK